MSCDWYVYCVDCDKIGGITTEANHRDDFARLLIEYRTSLESLGKFFQDKLVYDPEVKISGEGVDACFFFEHAGHKLRPRNEYGEFDIECGKKIRCSQCGEVVVCALLENHDLPPWEKASPRHQRHGHFSGHLIHYGEPVDE